MRRMTKVYMYDEKKDINIPKEYPLIGFADILASLRMISDDSKKEHEDTMKESWRTI